MLDLVIIRTTFFEKDVVDGNITESDTSYELREDLELHEAITIVRNLGLTFAASGAQYAIEPDGSHVIDYRTAEREEVSVHPQGMWWPHEYEAFVAAVDEPAGASLSFGYLVQPR